MAFSNFSVLALGSLLMAVPILLHLLMKKRPRHQIFPALRFLHQRQVANQRQMQLRNWLLLAMRLAAIGLLAAWISRPSVDSVGMGYWLRTLLLAVITPLALVAAAYAWVQQKGAAVTAGLGLIGLLLLAALGYFSMKALTTGNGKGLGDAQAPVAAALVVDTSPRMGLQYKNLTRLEEARQVARDLMKQLPLDSEVAIVDAASSGTFSVDLATAVNMVDSLQVQGREVPLADLVMRGIELVSDRDDKRKEVYVLTELSQQVWQESAFRPIKNRLQQESDLSLFVLDVGVDKPRNIQLGRLKLSTDSLAQGQSLQIDTELISENVDDTVQVELSFERPDATLPVIVDGVVKLPEPVTSKRDSQTLTSGASVGIQFTKRELNLPAGIHHGQVTVTSPDGLLVDNTRFFSFEVRPSRPVLLATSKGAEARYVQNAISPLELQQQGTSPFDCHVIEASQLLDQQLDDFAVVALLDPTSLTKNHWQRLAEFVRGGGGLAIFLGRNAEPVAPFNDAASAVLPGKLKSIWRIPPDNVLFFSPNSLAHPILTYFRGSVPSWDAAPIMKHWWLVDLKPDVDVIVRFSNNQPAIVESVLGAGRVITFTTPVSDKRRVAEPWNYFPTGEDRGLAFFTMMYGLFPYLSNPGESSWNNDVGEIVNLSTNAPGQQDETWQLFTPQGDWQNLRSDDGELSVTATESAGTYRLKPGRTSQSNLGFSVNLPSQATRVQRLAPDQLDTILGVERYILARGTDELSRGIGRARVGRELFPFLALMVVGLLAMEHLMSNRFYGNGSSQRDKRTTDRSTAGTRNKVASTAR